jgi:hypothetical protein
VTRPATGDIANTVFNADKCAQRNRIAAKRDGVNAVPFEFLPGAAGVYNLADLAATGRKRSGKPIYTEGQLPSSNEEAISMINALNQGGVPLSLEDVYIHYAEAAQYVYIPKYSMFLGDTTLKNIARDGAAGAAFMNSHKTGGMSSDAELPYGKTFCGMYEEYADGSQRAMVGMFMLRGVKPNGDSGPSTDDLNATIDAGTTSKVSVGLRGGYAVCDLCGCQLDARDPQTGAYLCPHAPGTKRAMTEPQIKAQKARGVEDGTATYTLHEARMPEISAVFAGAVAGAGFRKALGLARAGQMDLVELGQARSTYSALLSEGDFLMGTEIDEIVDQTSTQVAAKLEQGGFFERLAQRVKELIAPAGAQASPAAPATPVAPGAPTASAVEAQATDAGDSAREGQQAPEAHVAATQTPEYLALQAQLSATRAAQLDATAANFRELMLQDRRLSPGAAPEAVALYKLLSGYEEAQATPVKYTNAIGEEVELTGVALFEQLLKNTPQHSLTEEGKPAHVLVNSAATVKEGEQPEGARRTRKAKLLSMTPLGQAVAEAVGAEQTG